MPFADDRCLVAGLLQEFGDRHLPAVEPAVVVGKAIPVAVFAGEDHRPRGAADRIGTETVAKQGTLTGNPVDVGGVDQLRSIRRDGRRGVVIGKNEKDVGALGDLRRGDFVGSARRR